MFLLYEDATVSDVFFGPSFCVSLIYSVCSLSKMNKKIIIRTLDAAGLYQILYVTAEFYSFSIWL